MDVAQPNEVSMGNASFQDQIDRMVKQVEPLENTRLVSDDYENYVSKDEDRTVVQELHQT